MPSDPFIHMERANKTYGFTIAVKELRETVPNIFRYASAYKRVNNITSQGLWEMFAEPAGGPEDVSLPTDDPKYKPALPKEILSSEPGSAGVPDVDPEAMEGETYNMCHFWSNFEIARLDWFRSKEYNDFFNMMDRSGGFWMERVIYSALLNPSVTNVVSVGRCPNPLARSRSPLGSSGYTLLPRHWLSAYDNTALSSERARQPAAAQAAVSRDDDKG